MRLLRTAEWSVSTPLQKATTVTPAPPPLGPFHQLPTIRRATARQRTRPGAGSCWRVGVRLRQGRTALRRVRDCAAPGGCWWVGRYYRRAGAGFVSGPPDPRRQQREGRGPGWGRVRCLRVGLRLGLERARCASPLAAAAKGSLRLFGCGTWGLRPKDSRAGAMVAWGGFSASGSAALGSRQGRWGRVEVDLLTAGRRVLVGGWGGIAGGWARASSRALRTQGAGSDGGGGRAGVGFAACGWGGAGVREGSLRFAAGCCREVAVALVRVHELGGRGPRIQGRRGAIPGRLSPARRLAAEARDGSAALRHHCREGAGSAVTHR